MSKPWIILIMVILLLANLPLFFSKIQNYHILGFPPWAMYSLVMMIIFAVVISIFLGKYWDYLAVDRDDENNE